MRLNAQTINSTNNINHIVDLTDTILWQSILKTAQAIVCNEYKYEESVNDSWSESLAKMIADSKTIIMNLKKKVHVTVVFAVFEENNRMLPKSAHPHGEDFVREKIRQMAWFSDCPNFSWDILIVDDGCPENSGIEVQEIVKKYSSELNGSWPVSVLFLSDSLKENHTNLNLKSTEESKKGGAIYYGLSHAYQNKSKACPENAEHIVLYTDADLSAHLGTLGFALDKIINCGHHVAIGSRKLEPNHTIKSNPKAGNLWCYIWSSFFPELKVTDTQVGFKAFSAKILKDIFKHTLSEYGLCFDIELLLLANRAQKDCLAEFSLIWVDSIHESKIRKLGKDKCFFQQVQALSRLYKKYGQKNKWSDSFDLLITSLDTEMLDTLLSQCPLEIVERSPLELLSYRGVTAFELAALSCKAEIAKPKISMDIEWQKPPQSLDCWYETDDPDAICSARIQGEKCPLTIAPSLSNEGVLIYPAPLDIDMAYLQEHHTSLVDNLNKPFDPLNFSKTQSSPISVGFVENKELFCKWGPVPQAQNMPIKMPFTEFRISKELAQFEEALQKVADYWHAFNPEYGDYYYCYLSVSQSNVPPNCYQRRGHKHSDGFQSCWIKPKLFSDFSFIVSNIAPTEYFLQSFEVSHLDPSKHNYYKDFSKQLTVEPLRLQAPYEINMMDSYTLHKAIKNETGKPFQRTFLRFIFSVMRWERKGNAHNPMLNYQWPEVERNMMEVLE